MSAPVTSAAHARGERLRELWGPEPPYTPQPEDTQLTTTLCRAAHWVPNVPRVCFFTWLGDRVHRAVREELELPDLLEPVQTSRAHHCGRELSRELGRQWEIRHAWGPVVGTARVARRTTGAQAGTSGVGLLCYVGPVASFAEGARTTSSSSSSAGGERGWGEVLFAGVAWLTPPAPAAAVGVGRAETSAVGHPQSPLTPGQAARREAEAVWLHTAMLRRLRDRLRVGRPPHDSTGVDMATIADMAAAGTLVATYEPVESLVFLGAGGEDGDGGGGTVALAEAERAPLLRAAAATAAGAQALAGGSRQPRSVPKRMSVLRALLRSLGHHLWWLGPWRVVVDVTSLITPIVLQAYIKYLHSKPGDGADPRSASGSAENGFATPTAGAVHGSPVTAMHTDWQYGVGIAGVFFAVVFIHSVSLQKYTQLCYRCFYTFRSALSSVILEKALTIDAKSLSLPGLHTGRIVNMLTNDVEQLEQLALLFWPSIAGPINLCVATYLVYKLVGWAVFAGLSVSIMFMPVQVVLIMKTYRCYADKARATDARLKATNELLSGVRTVKFMSWEPVLLKKIQAKRAAEMALIKRAQNLWTMLSFSTDVLPSLVKAAFFATFYLSGNPLTAEVIFPTLSLVYIMCVPFRLMPLYASWLSSFFVSMQRITEFLERPDAADGPPGAAADGTPNPEDSDLASPGEGSPSGTEARKGEWQAFAVEYRRATITAFAAETPVGSDDASHSSADVGGAMSSSSSSQQQQQLPSVMRYYLKPVDVLTDITLKIPRGKLTIIIGPTGSGKSSLLSCLIGALEVTRGTVLVRENDASSTVYVPERPWVMDGSLAENITFFSPVDPARLDVTLAATHLAADLPALPDGLETRVGEKGIALSGGQQARLALARAAYPTGKELYLLDDPLSALDPRVAQLVMRDCILDLLRGTTRVLATHQTSLAPFADVVVVMAAGKIEFQGTYAAYKAYARGSAYKGRRSGFVEESGAGLPGSCAALDELLIDSAASPTGVDGLAGGGGVGSPLLPFPTTAPVLERVGETGVRSEVAHSAAAVLSPTLAASLAGRQEYAPLQLERALDEGVESGPAIHSMAGEEERARGPVPMALYKRYIRACGGTAALAAFTSVFVVSEIMIVSSNLWLSHWSDQKGEQGKGGGGGGDGSRSGSGAGTTHPPRSLRGLPGGWGVGLSEHWNVMVYLVCVTMGAIGLPLRYLVSLRFLRRGCRVLHEQLILAVSGATLGFFDSVPHARLLNRFSRDVFVIDGQLGGVVIAFGMSAAYLSSSLSIMLASQLLALMVVVPFVLVFYNIIVWNSAAVRSLQRLDNVATTPVVSALSDVMTGRWTITAFHRASDVLAEALRRIDVKFSASYTIVVAQVWVAVRVELLSATLLTSVALLGVASKHVPWLRINAGLISLTITNSSGFTAVLTRLMDACAALEASMNSVERVVQYTDNAPQEGGGVFVEEAAEDEEGARCPGESAPAGLRAGEAAKEYDEEDAEADGASREPSRGAWLGRPPLTSHRGSTMNISVDGGSVSNSMIGEVGVGGVGGVGSGSRLRARRGGAQGVGDVGSRRAVGESTISSPTSYTPGSLELRHVFLRYRPGLPFVLRDISFTVQPGERVGVVGRTGSGKSSLMLVFTRLVEATMGTVRVHGRDVSRYHRVEELRQLFTIVPQDPVLFDGTLRLNLDPLHASTDEEVWAALEHVGIAEYLVNGARGGEESASLGGTAAGEGGAEGSGSATAAELPPRLQYGATGVSDRVARALQTPIVEGGRNLSVGQRQLLCLARALLKRGSTFLLMDEATANVDQVLDRQIQSTVMSAFAAYTVITIAHRLQTVARYDKILVMDNGQLVAFGRPRELLSDTTSPFSQLVRSMGEDAHRRFMDALPH